jgi:phosphoribosylanthranilate isomerase
VGDSRAPQGPNAGPVLIKFCGLTRSEDARQAAALGAGYAGVILAKSPRKVDVQEAQAIFAAAGPDVVHVAVFGDQSPDEIATMANILLPDVIQLHGISSPNEIDAIRRRFVGRIWAVIGLSPDASTLPPGAEDLARAADGVLLDSRVDGRTGGTGVPLGWERLGAAVTVLHEITSVILAGGLDAGNVGAAVRALCPDVVDVSSGVERSPGKKDHDRMRAFAEAARSASIERGRATSSSSLETE